MNSLKGFIRDVPIFLLAYFVVATPFLIYAFGSLLIKLGLANILIGTALLTVATVIAKLLKKWANQ